VSEQSLRRGDDQVENVVVVGRIVNMLSKVEGQKREKVRGEVVSRIIEIC